MQRTTLGRTGIEVSRFGLGTMVLGAWGNQDRADCIRIVHRALDGGIDFVDTADVYAFGESEEIVGAALAQLPPSRRDQVVVATKFHNGMPDADGEFRAHRRGNSRRWIRRAVDESLRRLQLDHIDLYQVHRPDPSTELAETIDALTDLVRDGKIGAWGTSTFPAEELVEACWAAERRGVAGPHTEQPPYSILTRGIERDVLPTCGRHSIGVIVWSPLAGGWLTGKYRRGAAAPEGSRATTNPDHFDGSNLAKLDAVEALGALADGAGLTLTQLALAFTLEHPDVDVALIGPRTNAQLNDLLTAADVRLDAATLDAIDAIVAPGTDLNPADKGWVPPGLDPRNRRR